MLKLCGRMGKGGLWSILEKILKTGSLGNRKNKESTEPGFSLCRKSQTGGIWIIGGIGKAPGGRFF
jgi:hypothetical protein